MPDNHTTTDPATTARGALCFGVRLRRERRVPFGCERSVERSAERAAPAAREPDGILLRYFNFDAALYKQIQQYAAFSPGNARQMQVDALTKLNITVAEGQAPLTAWVLEMARINHLPEVTPQLQIGGAAADLCPQWIWFLA